MCRGDIPNISEDRYGYVVWIGLKKTTFYSVLEWKYTREYIYDIFRVAFLDVITAISDD